MLQILKTQSSVGKCIPSEMIYSSFGIIDAKQMQTFNLWNKQKADFNQRTIVPGGNYCFGTSLLQILVHIIIIYST